MPTKKPAMVIFKLDFCLFVYSPVITSRQLAQYSNALTSIQIPGFTFPHYLIDSFDMGKILRALEEKHIPIGFLTEFDYDADRINIALGRHYQLKPETMAQVTFIKYQDFPLAEQTDWGIVSKAQENKLIPDSRVLLITDNRPVLDSLQTAQLHIIRACGIPNPHFGYARRDALYKNRIAEILGLDIFQYRPDNSLYFRGYRTPRYPYAREYAVTTTVNYMDEGECSFGCTGQLLRPFFRQFY